MDSRKYDVAIIGGGIIGLSTALWLTERYPRHRVVVIEKEKELAVHQTGHNSGVIHSGIYYRPGSSGVESLIRCCEANDIEYERCGKVIVATDESELGRLEDLYQRGTANGVQGLEIIGPERLKEIEPHTTGIKALYAPGTGIVDYKKVANAYADNLCANGGEVLTDSEVRNIRRSAGSIFLETTQESLESKYLINCAGLHADKVARMMGVSPDVRIIPFRGEYYTLNPQSRHLVKSLIYPVPNPRFPFLGVHFTRNAHGEVEAGPNAVLAFAREGYRKTNFNAGDTLGTLGYPGFWAMTMKHWRTGVGEMHRSFMKSVFLHDLQRLLPEVKSKDLVSGGSGVRAQAVDKRGRLLDDFSIQETEGAIHVLNAPSPGATSSLSIGEHIVSLAAKSFDLATAS
ncbi:MAG: L-2-hydroxyglutarate oxidase [Dehalococcoidia bacterium]|nr:L-2-hydroxyglutarate oxidase [Dehalococcoidia bacterium]